MTGQLLDRQEWRQHGWIVLPSLVGMILIGVSPYTLGVMITPLEQEFGWSRAAISSGLLIPAFGSLVLAPLVGRAVDRFGSRPVALLGVPFFCAALASLSLAGPGIYSWLALYALVGVATMFIFPHIWAAAISRRFVRNRGIALAIALAGTGVASAVMPFVTSLLVVTTGWRGAYVGIGVLCFAVAFPIVFLLFEPGTKKGRGQTEPKPFEPAPRKPVPWTDLTSLRFLKLVAATFFFSLCACALTTNVVPILMAEGFDLVTSAKIAGLVGLGTIIGRLGGGILLDRINGRFVAMGTCAAPLMGVAALLATHQAPEAAMFACFAIGLSAGAEYDAAAYLSGRYFSLENYGFLFGIVASLTLIGAAIAPVVSNFVFDVTRSYDLVLWGMFPVFLLAGFLFLMLGRYPETAPLDAGEESDAFAAGHAAPLKVHVPLWTCLSSDRG